MSYTNIELRRKVSSSTNKRSKEVSLWAHENSKQILFGLPRIDNIKNQVKQTYTWASLFMVSVFKLYLLTETSQ